MDSIIVNSLIKKLKEINIQTTTSVITFFLDNELDAIITQSHLLELFKNNDLELYFKISHPQNIRKSKIDFGIIAINSDEFIQVKEVEIDNAAALYSKLLYLKSHMNGFIQNEEPRYIGLIFSSIGNGSSHKKNEPVDPGSNGYLKIKKLTLIPTPGGSDILKIPHS